jgi:integrase
VYRRYIYPALHQYELAEIKREHIQILIKSLPPQTGATTLAVLKTIFREAIDNAYCEHSPAAAVRRPKIQVIPRKFIPLPELVALELPKFKTQIVFLAMHGLRWGEAVALTESDIYDGRVHISKSIHGIP